MLRKTLLAMFVLSFLVSPAFSRIERFKPSSIEELQFLWHDVDFEAIYVPLRPPVVEFPPDEAPRFDPFVKKEVKTEDIGPPIVRYPSVLDRKREELKKVEEKKRLERGDPKSAPIL